MAWLIPQEEVVGSPAGIGAKARVLAVVAQECGHVPSFIVIPTAVVEALWKREEDERASLLQELATEVSERLPGETVFAVRSAALNEDQAQQSLAGQFHTELAVALPDLPQAIWKVVQMGVVRLRGQFELFSCFVQVFHEAEISGVTFTRGPEGDPRLFVEYHLGRGEALVSGQVQPTILRRFWGDDRSFQLPKVQASDELLLVWKQLEASFGHPQDIEWCAVRGEWWLLQARPITTISASVYQGLLEADAVLPVQQSFLYEQTEITELAPHPSAFTLSLLERIYAEDGPITAVYQALGVAYDPRDFFSLVSGWLYVDREEELKTLLPSFTLLDPKEPGVPHKRSLLASVHAMKLQQALSSVLRTPVPVQLGRLEEALTRSEEEIDIAAWGRSFLMIYETIFETNLFTQQAISRLASIVSRGSVTISALVAAQFVQGYRLDLASLRTLLSQEWRGNSLDVADISAFEVRGRQDEASIRNTADEWWEGLSALSRAAYEPVIRTAVQADQLREVGRWVTVRWINRLRYLLQEAALVQGFSFEESIQVRLEEWEEGMPERATMDERGEAFTRSASYRLPSRLTNLTVVEKDVLQGLSAGKAEGRLVVLEELDQLPTGSDAILLVEQLRPELAPLLPRVKGILTARGGMLSHLAIIAREERVPVVSGISFSEWRSRCGKHLRLDGGTGEVSCLDAD